MDFFAFALFLGWDIIKEFIKFIKFIKLYHIQLTSFVSSSRAGTRDPRRVTTDVDSESSSE
jgi:hypothetical protein